MTFDSIIHIITLTLAPVVMITCCAILLNGLLSRYDSVNARMREMHRERLELLQGLWNTTSSAEPTVGFSNRRVHEIEVQLPNLLRRHKLLNNAVLSENTAIVLLVLSMFIIALAEMTNSTFAATIALFAFFAGTGSLLVGVMITNLELSQSRREVAFEIQDGLRLSKEDLK